MLQLPGREPKKPCFQGKRVTSRAILFLEKVGNFVSFGNFIDSVSGKPTRIKYDRYGM